MFTLTMYVNDKMEKKKSFQQLLSFQKGPLQIDGISLVYKKWREKICSRGRDEQRAEN